MPDRAAPLAEIGPRICDGQPRGDEVTRLTDLSADIVEQRAVRPRAARHARPPSVVRYFRDELDAHILRNTCPAGICHPKADARAGAAS